MCALPPDIRKQHKLELRETAKYYRLFMNGSEGEAPQLYKTASSAQRRILVPCAFRPKLFMMTFLLRPGAHLMTPHYGITNLVWVKPRKSLIRRVIQIKLSKSYPDVILLCGKNPWCQSFNSVIKRNLHQLPLWRNLFWFRKYLITKSIIKGLLHLFSLCFLCIYVSLCVCNHPAWCISGLGGDGWERCAPSSL